jgi:hypothetical protein
MVGVRRYFPYGYIRPVGSRWGVSLVAVVALSAGVFGCDSSSADARHPGRDPAPAARLFCGPRAKREISTSLGIRPTRVSEPTLEKHRFSCHYLYPEGVIGLSVQGFPDGAAASRYVDRLGRQHGRRPEPPQLGESLSAFVTTDGSIVVRNRRDVLEVDVTALPADFGRPSQPASVVSLAVAVTILGHWVPG